MSISVVGNAASIFLKKHGRLIDASEMVVRFNGGVIVKPESQGQKTTVLAYSGYKKNVKDFGSVEYWVTVAFPEREYLAKKLGAIPSNGLVVLERLKNLHHNRPIRIFGFDWKATPTWYLERPLDKHDYEKERAYCLQLSRALDWRIY